MIKFYNNKVQFREDYTKKAKYMLNTYFDDRFLVEVDNIIFQQTFIFSHFDRGRSSVVAVFISKDKIFNVSMFISNLEEMLVNSEVNFPEITGYWTFVKKGMNIGIKYIGATQPIIHNIEIKTIESLFENIDSSIESES